jgi:hypothetical protein
LVILKFFFLFDRGFGHAQWKMSTPELALELESRIREIESGLLDGSADFIPIVIIDYST